MASRHRAMIIKHVTRLRMKMTLIRGFTTVAMSLENARRNKTTMAIMVVVY